MPNAALAAGFLHSLRQKGGMISKGRILGIQFETLLTDDLYIQLGDHANKMADILRQGLESAGFTFLIASPTNQQFPLFSGRAFEELSKRYGMRAWVKAEHNQVFARVVTSWATKEENVRAFVADAIAVESACAEG